MKLGFKDFGRIFYEAGYNTVYDDGIEHAGYLAFLGILSIFPSLIFMVMLAGSLGRADYGAEFIEYIFSVLPQNVTTVLSPRVQEILSSPPKEMVTIAVIGILWTASSSVEGIRTILNRIYRVKNPPKYILRRLLSIFQFIILSFIIIIAIFFLTVIPGIAGYIERISDYRINISSHLTDIRFFGSALALFLGVSLSYYTLPNIRQRFMRVMPGAFIVNVVWVIAANMLTFYVTYYQQVNVVYGGLAGIILTLVFFYVMGVIYIYGAEFNYALEKALGHKIEAKE